MEKVEKIELILSHNWSDVYDICDTVQECSDYILANVDDDEEMLIHEEWHIFSDMIDDAYHYGFTDYYGKTYKSMEEDLF